MDDHATRNDASLYDQDFYARTHEQAEAFASAYADSRELAASETELPLSAFPTGAPFSCDDALSRAWAPRPVSPERRAD